MYTATFTNRKGSEGYTGDLVFPLLAYSSTEVSTELIMAQTRSVNNNILGLYFGLHDTLKPIVLPENYNFAQGFALAYGNTH